MLLLWFSVALLLAVLTSSLANRTILSTAVLFLGAGFALGEDTLGVLDQGLRLGGLRVARARLRHPRSRDGVPSGDTHHRDLHRGPLVHDVVVARFFDDPIETPAWHAGPERSADPGT